MIRIFRTARQRLLRENRFTRYALYAVGEILLVMIGILLALKVNDWRDYRNLRQKERKTLELLIRDLREDRNKLEVFDRKLREQEQAVIMFMNCIENECNPDSVLTYAAQAIRGWNYRPTYPTYEGLKLSGALDIISSPDIRDQIIEYHDETIPYLEDLRAAYQLQGHKLRDALEPYIGHVYTDDDWKITGDFSTPTFQSDRQAIHVLSNLGNRCDWMVQRIDQLFYPENQEVTDSLTLYLQELH
ncbi:MAG: hypothetical protein ABR95_07660 [Sphingobacteriales bacterium BACL12 MAG-120813-bin55]|jgi:hypothetical protein|nr:MAG: hypothetical protein ABR94_02875 [Sphingobacteriales bacterium BACL12 MAG-120802-bin5]KRP12457.1 MAG: hypothetical protein ABR95_07660 [Sphingobacteriales bacterium BACL12 MAG-120813-bin55]